MRSKVRAVAALALCGCVGMGARGAEPQAVEVIGSRVGPSLLEEPLPVQVITAEEIRLRGANSLLELLRQSVANAGGIEDVGTGATFASGSGSIAMRRLGPMATLVLLNGRRLPPYPLINFNAVFVNTESLPLQAIERIEILGAGASALYGSEAIAGVVNIVTRRQWKGAVARASHERSATSGRFQNSNLSLAAGFGGDGADDAHLTVSLEGARRESVMWRDIMPYVRPEYFQRSPGFGTWSTYSWPGNVIGAGPVPGCAPENLRNGLCMYDRYTRFEALPASERGNLLLLADKPLDARTRLFGEALVAYNTTTYQYPYQAYGPSQASQVWGNPATQSVQTFDYRGLPAGHPLNTTGADGADFRYRFVDGPNYERPRTVQYRLLGGGSGSVQPFDWEAALGVMGGRTRLEQRGAFSLSGFRETIGATTAGEADPLFFNRSYRIGQANDAAVLDRLFPVYGYTGEVRHVFADARVRGPVGSAWGRPVDVAVGAELRHEHHAMLPGAALQQGDIVGNALAASDASRWVWSLFGEAVARPNAGAELQAALRVDRHGSFSPHLSPMLALRQQLGAAWALRTSASGGFRAPNLMESTQSTLYNVESYPDAARCPQAQALAADLRTSAGALPAGDPARTVLLARADNVTTAECLATINSVVSPNPQLKPETARSFNLGLVFSPGPDLNASIDAWDVVRRNEIGMPGTDEVLAEEAIQPAGTIGRLPLAGDGTFSADEQARYGVTAGRLAAIVKRFQNQARTWVRGVDVVARWGKPKPFAAIPAIDKLQWQTDAQIILQHRIWRPALDGWGLNLANRYGAPRWNLNNAITVHSGGWTHNLRAASYSSAPLEGDYFDTAYAAQACISRGQSADDCRNPGRTVWSYALRWTAGRELTLTLNVNNLFGSTTKVGMSQWLANGGLFPLTTEDARRRMVRVGAELGLW